MSTTETSTDWVETARQIAERFRPGVAERERKGTPPTEEIAELKSSGLVNILIPKEFGGLGGSPVDAARIISELSFVDPNVGGIFAYHCINFIPALLDYETDNETLQRRSAENRWIWGNVTQPFVPVHATPTDDGGYVLNGTKPLNTGVPLVDSSTVFAHRTDEKAVVYLAVPRDREGQTFHDDWDAMGFRRSQTVSITFEDVKVEPDEVYIDTHPGPRTGFPPLYVGPGNLYFASIQIGAARGALYSATSLYLEDADRRGLDPTEDGDALQVIGRLAAQVQATVAFRDRVARLLGDIQARRTSLTDEDLIQASQQSEALRLYSAKVAIDVGSEVYELPGVGQKADEIDLDRFWRDARLHSLHLNPRIYHLRMVGDVFLNGTDNPNPSFLV